MARSRGRTGRPWRRAQAKVLSQIPLICGICGNEMDKAIEWPDPLSPTVDHIQPLGDDGAELDLNNLQPAHLHCNSSKGKNRRSFSRNSRKWL